MSSCRRPRRCCSYDADGNLTNDGHWAYTWDAENRLVKMAANTVGRARDLVAIRV